MIITGYYMIITESFFVTEKGKILKLVHSSGPRHPRYAKGRERLKRPLSTFFFKEGLYSVCAVDRQCY